MSGLIGCTLALASTLTVTAGFCARACSAAIRNTTTYPHTILGRDMQSLLTVRRVHLSSSPLALFCVRAAVIVSHATGPISVTMLTKVGHGIALHLRRRSTLQQPHDALQGNPQPIVAVVELIVQLVQRLVQDQCVQQGHQILALGGHKARSRSGGEIA